MLSTEQWLRNRVVAKYWCDKMREILSRQESAAKLAKYNPQLPLPHIWRPK